MNVFYCIPHLTSAQKHLQRIACINTSQESIYSKKARMKNNYHGYHHLTGFSEINPVPSQCKFLFPIQVGKADVNTLWTPFQFSYYLEERHK